MDKIYVDNSNFSINALMRYVILNQTLTDERLKMAYCRTRVFPGSLVTPTSEYHAKCEYYQCSACFQSVCSLLTLPHIFAYVPVSSCSIVQFGNALALTIATESEKSPHQIDSQIVEVLFQTIYEILEGMSDSEFEIRKSAIETRIKKTSQNLKDLSEEYWDEITNRVYNFNRVEMELGELSSVKKGDLIAFFKEMLDKSSPKRRKLAVHVHSKRTANILKSPDNIPPDVTAIEDMTAFKSGATLLPHALPYISIGPLGTKLVRKNPRAYLRRKSTLKDRLLHSVSVKVREASLRNIGNMSRQTGVVLPKDVKLLETQVGGGHTFLKGKTTKGILEDSEGNILKPIPHSGPAEIYFYENLKTTNDPVLLELKEFIPVYLGTSVIKFENEDVTCLRLENVTKGFELPCVMDIKLGIQTWEPSAPKDKISRKQARFVQLKEHLGFGIPGFRYHNVNNGNFVRQGKEFCKTMSAEMAVQEIFNFVNGDIGIRCGLLTTILERLRKIRSWFQRQRKFYFFSGSILLVYDAKKLISFMNNNENDLDVNDCPKIQVYFIDFAHAIPSPGTVDTNCLNSLNKLIYVFDNLKDLYAKSLHETVFIGELLKNESKGMERNI